MRVLLAAVMVMSVACARQGMVDDGTSVSWGKGNRGWLTNGVRLPVEGDGYHVPPRWRLRGSLYGTDELVTLLVRVGRRLQAEVGGPPLGIADLSPLGGGRSRWHRSHQSGRDVDLLFFMADSEGLPVAASWMTRVGADGQALGGGAFFDVDRNWAVVRALLEEPQVAVQYIFVYEPLKFMLLDHARAIGEPDELVRRAEYLLHQPGDAAPHDDHFHVRVYCADSDRGLGCDDRGTLRWSKKFYKYGLLVQRTVALPAALRARISGAGALIGLGWFPLGMRP